jgi:probable rRNA maturation factor
VSSILDNNLPDHGANRDHCDSPSPQVDILVDPSVVDSVDQTRVKQAVVAAARYRGFTTGRIGIRITDNPTIHQCNCQFMHHDYPTDVISFGYDLCPPRLEGEMIVSAEMARQRARDIGWSADSELLLYVVHGTLHISGMDDQQAESRAQMRTAEQHVLVGLGVDEIMHFGADIHPQSRWRPEDLA